jgi:hypothetical protein
MSNRLPLILSALALVLAPIGGFLGSYAASESKPAAAPTPSPSPARGPLADLSGSSVLVLGGKCPPGSSIKFPIKVALVGPKVRINVVDFDGKPFEFGNPQEILTVSGQGMWMCEFN